MAKDSVSIVAMGGNSLISADLAPTVENQFHLAAQAVKPIADLIELGHRLVITHGNGPQVGFMALRSELSREHIHEMPLDSLVANTQGSLGYMIQPLGEEFVVDVSSMKSSVLSQKLKFSPMMMPSKSPQTHRSVLL